MASPSGPCQPALSSTRTMLRRRPAPVCRAKAARRASKRGFERPVERYQSASPLVGRTKAVTCSHSWRWWPSATGRTPTGAQTRRRTGFRPRRCSSSAQTSTGRPGCAARARATAAPIFLSAPPAPRAPPRAGAAGAATAATSRAAAWHPSRAADAPSPGRHRRGRAVGDDRDPAGRRLCGLGRGLWRPAPPVVPYAVRSVRLRPPMAGRTPGPPGTEMP